MSVLRHAPEVEPIGARRFDLGESARWDGARLSLVDIHSGDLWVGDCRSIDLAHHIGVPLGAANPSGTGFLLSAGDGIARLDDDGCLTWLARPLAGLTPPRRMNDAAADPSGTLWFGSMDEQGTPGNGSLFRLDADGVVMVADSLGCPNGPAFSPDGRVMYLADSTAGTVLRCAPETPANGSIFARPPAGVPDGMAVDESGVLWVALWGGSALARYQPTGELLDLITLPVQQPTSVCFAAGHVVTTSARRGLTNPGPLDGAVLVFDVGN